MQSMSIIKVPALVPPLWPLALGPALPALSNVIPSENMKLFICITQGPELILFWSHPYRISHPGRNLNRFELKCRVCHVFKLFMSLTIKYTCTWWICFWAWLESMSLMILPAPVPFSKGKSSSTKRNMVTYSEIFKIYLQYLLSSIIWLLNCSQGDLLWIKFTMYRLYWVLS